MPTFHFEPAAYGPAVAGLLTPERLPELGPGRPNHAARELLSGLTPESLLAQPGAGNTAPHRLGDRFEALACLAGLWLHHDFLDESHHLSQEIDTVEGSFWHAVMHRREHDFGNAKYWFRRVGHHDIGPALVTAAREQVAGEQVAGESQEGAADFLATQTSWDHFRFVDLCETAAAGDTLTRLCRKIQFCEWQLLFDHCFRRAVLPLAGCA